jgi:hypothetical protein
VPNDQQSLREALKHAASALAAAGVPFALGGSYALWVHGAPEPGHDADLVIAEQDTEQAAAILAEAGFEIDRPPEAWLFKARADDALVDVLHGLNGEPVSPERVAAAERLQVLGVWMPVLSATDVMTVKLASLDEHYCDFATLLPLTRAVREQLDWQRMADATKGNDFAVAFLFLAERLGVGPGGPGPD